LEVGSVLAEVTHAGHRQTVPQARCGDWLFGGRCTSVHSVAFC